MTKLRPGAEFERIVADTFHELWPLQSWSPNAKILGDSGMLREIDLSMRGIVTPALNGIKIVEAKDWNRRIPAGEIDKFYGLLSDVRADEGAMVAAKGYTTGAMKRANAANISLLSMIDPEGDHRWQWGFNASTLFLVTLIEDIQLNIDYECKYVINESGGNALCLRIYDEQRRELGSLHDFVFDLSDLPLEDCILSGYPITKYPVLIRDVGAASGFRKVFLTCELKISTEAWIKKVPLLRGRGLFNENLGRALLADNAIFEDFDISKLREQWSRIRNLDLLQIESMLTMRVTALNHRLYSLSHQCQRDRLHD